MKNWKTTLTGIIGACATWLITYLSTGTVDVKTLTIGLVLVVLGVLSKDFDVTGGNRIL